MYEKVVKGIIVFIVILFVDYNTLYAQQDFSLRRPISPEQPMWLVHIDTWNYPDPQKIIDLIPKDIRPYVVMNISLSTFHDSDTYRFTRAEYGAEIAKSWLRTCAENRMWAMVQPASGGYSHFPDGDMPFFEDFFTEFPNFLGFNYAEQFWGFGEDNPYSPEWSERMSHFADLLELSNKYGGYLVVSICWNKWNPGVNPIGMLKRSSEFAEACSMYTENYMLFDKHTQVSYLHDRESMCLGAYLSGYSGQYGIRYDDTGWTDANGNHHENFTMATYGAPFLEHTMLTGLTSFDGPELIWTQCFKEVDAISTSDGYSTRSWETFPQFDNVSVDLFRKVLDGTVRIPDREEVIERTKYVLVHDVNSGSDDNKYSSPATLYQGLYRMDNDGNHGQNWSFFKKTGRYPTIPIVYDLDDEMANSFDEVVRKSGFSNRWPSIASKVDEFNQNFPEEYTGDIYAGRLENGWVTYNPFKTGQTASGSIPFKYNTCERIELSYSRYTSGVIKEYAEYLDIYLNNFDNVLNGNLKTDVIKIYGSTSEPDYTVTDRGKNHKSKVKNNWDNGVFTLTIDHNGPVDIKINCSGNATNRLTEYQTANIVVPHSPPAYSGTRQYEAETFDYKNIAGIEKNAADDNIRNYTGQGYLHFGTNRYASVRDHVTVLNDGTYNLITKYTLTGGNVNTIDLFVNGEKVATPLFEKSTSISNWGLDSQLVELEKGENVIEFKAFASSSNSVAFDNIIIESENSDGVWMEAECGNAGSMWGELTDNDASNNSFLGLSATNNDNIPENENSQVSYTINNAESGTYTVWVRVKKSAAGSASLWFKTNNDNWTQWNINDPVENWEWVELGTSALIAGEQSLTVSTASGNLYLDKLFISKTGTVSEGKGGPATNCSAGNQLPIAFAGSDITLIDSDNDGKVTLKLNSTGSIDPDGSIADYSWGVGIVELASGANPSLELPVGVHNITLTVIDNEGAKDTDDVKITVFEGTYDQNTIWLEAECGEVGSNWDVITDETASNASYITVKSGIESTGQAPANDEGLNHLTFNIVSPATYTVYARVNCPSANDDSFWVRMNSSSFRYYNGLKTSGWEWVVLGTYNLSEGEQKLTIGYREDGALLDKLFITKYSDAPSGVGDQAINCGTGPGTDVTEFVLDKHGSDALMHCYPNPFSSTTSIKYRVAESGYVNVSVYNMNGQEVSKIINGEFEVGEYETTWEPGFLPEGLYVIKLQTKYLTTAKKLIYKQ